MKLTDFTLRTLEPNGRLAVYRDDSLVGFGVRITPNGVRSFFLQHGNDRATTTIGRYGIITLAEARTAARRILAQKTLGTYQPRSIKFSEALDTFVATHCADIKTGYEYERMLKREFLPKLGAKTLDKITPHDLYDILDKLSPSVAYHAFVYLKAFFNWTIQRSYLEDTPLRKMKKPKKAAGRARVLTDDELKRVWNACDTLGTYGTIVRLLVATGQRRDEIAKLQDHFVELTKMVITLPAWLTKNKREHTFPIIPRAASLIPRNKGLLCPAPCSEGKKPYRQFGKAKLELDRLCGFSDWTLHDLRRTYRTIHARIGTPPHVAERLINHVGSTSEVQKIYDRYLYEPEMLRAVQAYKKELNKILEQN
jgi:integrase